MPPASRRAGKAPLRPTLHFDRETVQLFHPPNAHTDSDTLVHFKRANVIHASRTIGGDGGYVFFADNTVDRGYRAQLAKESRLGRNATLGYIQRPFRPAT